MKYEMSRKIKLDEVKEHNSEDSAWVIIHNHVYDLTTFLEEHPGGAESILEHAGKDGTQAFEDVGHSQDARDLMVKFKIGTLPEDQRVDEKCYKTKTGKKDKSSSFPHLNTDVIVLATTRPWRRGSRLARYEDGANSESGGGSGSGSGGTLKWAILALASAIIIGIVMHKYMK